MVLGQRKVDEKSNEMNTLPELLKPLEISGYIVMIGAIGTQTKITKTIIDKKGHYLLVVKGNQGYLFEVFKSCLSKLNNTILKVRLIIMPKPSTMIMAESQFVNVGQSPNPNFLPLIVIETVGLV